MIFALGKSKAPNSALLIDLGTGVAVLFTLFAFFMYSLEYKKIKDKMN